MQFIVSILLGSVALMVVAQVVPNFRIRGGFGNAVVVALVYGVLKMLLQKVLIVLTLPAVVLTLGLFILVINGFLLWLTDKLLERFEVRTTGALVLGTVLLTVIDLAFQMLLRQGTIF
jgi:putative membrane protein